MPRARMVRDIPPPLELACLTVLWGLEQGSVKDVRQAVAASHPLAYTTVMTVLDRLARRGLITRTKAGRAFVYAPAVSRDKLRRLALQEFLASRLRFRRCRRFRMCWIPRCYSWPAPVIKTCKAASPPPAPLRRPRRPVAPRR